MNVQPHAHEASALLNDSHNVQVPAVNSASDITASDHVGLASEPVLNFQSNKTVHKRMFNTMENQRTAEDSQRALELLMSV
eukprot:Em0033g16a